MNIQISIKADWFQKTFDQEMEINTSDRDKAEEVIEGMLDNIFEENIFEEDRKWHEAKRVG
jgi:hypothetical protein